MFVSTKGVRPMGGFNVGNEVRNLVNQMERDNPDISMSAHVKSAWNRAVGPDVAQHVTAVFVVPHTQAQEVIVYVDSPIRAADLNMQSEILRMKLNIELGNSAPDAKRCMYPEQVKKLKFVASKEKYIKRARRMTTFEALEEQEKQEKDIESVPLTEDELAELAASVASIEDERLRVAAYDAAKANLEWQKGQQVAERK